MGAAYLFVDSPIGWVDAADAELVVYGEATHESGYRISSAGDPNVDGFDDVLIEGGDGVALLFNGPASGVRDATSADVVFMAEAPGHLYGGVAPAGDANGDGCPDVLLGDTTHDEGEPDAGAAFVMLGPFAGDHQVSDSAHTFVGDVPRAYAGTSVAAGHFDGDASRDFVAGEPRDEVPGCTYVFLGPPSGVTPLAEADVAPCGDGDAEAGSDVAVRDVDHDGSGPVGK